jgi:antitoxin component YwqK of YwqJK toxin-antitoxin module
MRLIFLRQLKNVFFFTVLFTTINAQTLDTFARADTILYGRYETGELNLEVPFVKNLIHGEVKEYLKNGQLIFSQKFYMGRPFGMRHKYNKEKVLIEQYEYNYDDNVKNGKALEYWENGKIKSEGQYLNDKKVGVWYSYLNTRLSYSVHTYVDGVTQGKYQYYYLNQLAEEGNFVNECLDGVFKTYDEKGKIIREEFWKSCSMNSSNTKNYTSNYKPDTTQEVIAGIEYIWFGGRRYEKSKR